MFDQVDEEPGLFNCTTPLGRFGSCLALAAAAVPVDVEGWDPEEDDWELAPEDSPWKREQGIETWISHTTFDSSAVLKKRKNDLAQSVSYVR